MCGIVGTVDFVGRKADDADRLDMMAELVRHRGPDSSGRWVRSGPGPSVAFGHRRLAVLDLSDCAAQPMRNAACVAAGRATPLVLVFNGEIYNYRDLRAGLIGRGHRLESDTDSEVILHLYEELGTACIRELRGMFALALWDEAEGRLMCARDRIGKKPFYYRHDGARFWFASEVRAILSDPDVPIAVDSAAIQSYLRLGFVPAPQSAFQGIARLLPGHLALVDHQGFRQERYWQLSYTPKRTLDSREATAELHERLREAVRLRLVSDVPLGAFLSGGVDSAAVVAAMCEESARVETFSIGFDDKEYDELKYASEVAARLGTTHHEFVVTPDAAAVAPKLAWHYGEPFADSSAVPTYYLAQLARSRITVALNGDGGDESFAGYTRYQAYQMALRYQRLPPALRATLENLAGMLTAASAKSNAHRAGRFFRGASFPSYRLYARWFEFFGGHDAALDRQSSTDEEVALAPLRLAFEHAAALHPVEAAMAADVALYLPDDLLVKVDIATMAHGLEARSPLLDHQLMEFAARLPVNLKVRHGQKKWLLKRVLRGRVPEGVLRRPKMGFGVPLDSWFRSSLRPMLNDLLGAEQAGRGFFRSGAVRRLIEEHHTERTAHGQRLWCLLMLELWFRTYIDAARPSATHHSSIALPGHA